MRVPAIVDTTLRDGEQAPGVAFSIKEKITIARMLDRLGVDIIEAGIPAMGGMEKEALRIMAGLGLRARVISWNRMKPEDIEESLSCGIRDLHVSVPVSDLHINCKLGKSRSWVIETTARCVGYARECGCRVSVGAEDASRADGDFLLEFALGAQEAGAERLRYADTVGILDPFTTYDKLSRLAGGLKIPLEFHGHNDFGLATANTLGAVRAGVRWVDTTIGGLGERAGNAGLEELSEALRHIYGLETGLDPVVLSALGRYVAVAANRRPGRYRFNPTGPERRRRIPADTLNPQRRVRYA